MILELRADENADTLIVQVSDIDHLYQTEQWVIDTRHDHTTVIRWVLLSGETMVWT